MKTKDDLLNRSALREQAEKKLKGKHAADDDLSRLTPQALITVLTGQRPSKIIASPRL